MRNLLHRTNEHVYHCLLLQYTGQLEASWLVRLTPDHMVWVRVLAKDIVVCSWARHFTYKVPLSTQVYKWVPGGVEILLVTSYMYYRNRDKLQPDVPLGLYADFNYTGQLFTRQTVCKTEIAQSKLPLCLSL